jgi:ATP-dependent Clp protease ATP-binding subunit ClpB
MTSNLGSQLWMNKGENKEVTRAEVNALMQTHFKPEFINRVDEIVIFHPLNKENLKQIVEIQLQRMKKLLLERGFTLKISDGAKQYLADAGYDPDYGARPLKRAIQYALQDPLAMEVLSGNIKPGEEIYVSVGPDGLEFTPVVQETLAA